MGRNNKRIIKKKIIFIALFSIAVALIYLIIGFHLFSIKGNFYRGVMHIKIGMIDGKVRKIEEIRPEIGYIIKNTTGDTTGIEYGVLRVGYDVVNLIVEADSDRQLNVIFEKVRSNFIDYNNRLLSLYETKLHKNVELYKEVKESSIEKITDNQRNKTILLTLLTSGIFYGLTVFIIIKRRICQ